MTALALASLARLPAGVARPAFDPRTVRVGIVHLGLGAFHRAHQAMYTDAVLALRNAFYRGPVAGGKG
jgi:fructuronate reductase